MVTNSFVTPTYGVPALEMDRGEGVYLFDTNGKRYLDFAAGIAVNALGHGHPTLVRALKQQADQLWHTSNLYRIPGQERLAQRLCEASFADRVQFCNSGAEAVEGCVKYARKYQHSIGQAQRYRVITFDGSFHGRTLATIAAAKGKKLVEGFGPEVDGFDLVPFGNLNAVRDAIGDETAAILVEPVQGEGGIRPAHLSFLQDLRATCDEFGLLLIMDEIQCGVGRSGKLFAHEWAGVTPDLMAVAKGIGGGFPMGAILSTLAAAQGMTAGTHGTTYGGNPLAMAVGNALLDEVLADGFLDQVDLVARQLWFALLDLQARHPGMIDQVRGAGLMLGVRLNDTVTNGAVVDALRAGGLLTVPAGDNVVRVLPPLIITPDHVAEAIEIFDTTLSSL